MKLSFEEIKTLLEKYKYIPTDEIVWNTIKAIKLMMHGNLRGQGIYSVVLEGAPGAGKSFYAETYRKVLQDFFGEDVAFVEYQCDSTTGKSDLYEEIDVAQAIIGDPEKVIVEGKLLEAINLANQGKKVIVFLDEFEKSRRETDAFMFGFEQSGKVITTQKGKAEVKPEYRKNLQVILCKNDERDLSDPLLRRNRIIRLDVMTPENFSEAIDMNLSDLDEDIRNIVKLLYEKMYGKKDDFLKFPSCSEGMQAIQDACYLLEAGAPAQIIYADILSNMLKHPDDIEDFKKMFKRDDKLSSFVDELLKKVGPNTDFSVRDEIYRNFFSKEIQELAGAKELYDNLTKMKQGNLGSDVTFSKVGNLSDVSQNQASSQGQEGKDKTRADLGNDLVKMEEVRNVSPVPMPSSIVYNPKSVFADNPTNHWYEIMEFEVNEEGWDTIRELAEAGHEPWEKRISTTSISTLHKRFPEFLNSLCIDGMILQDDKTLGLKIVAIKEDCDDSHFYRIFSNRRIQPEVIFGKQGDSYYSNTSKPLTHYFVGLEDIIGINGLLTPLIEQHKILKTRRKYLLFSLTSEKRIIQILQDTDSNYSDERKFYGPKYNKKLMPGLFLIEREYEGKRRQFPGTYYIQDRLYTGRNLGTPIDLPPETTRWFLDMYDELLEKEPEKPAEKGVENPTEKGEEER